MRFFSKSGIVVLTLNLLGFFGGGFFGRQLYNDANRVIAAYQELYVTARGKESLSLITKSLFETADARIAVAQAFLHPNGLVNFIEQLESLARKSSVVLALDEPKPTTGKIVSLNLTWRATGSFAGLYRFLTLLENLPYRLDWQSVTWNFVSGTTWSGNFSVAITSYINSDVVN